MNLLLRQRLRIPDRPAFSQYHLLPKASGRERSLPTSEHNEMLFSLPASKCSEMLLTAVFTKARLSYPLPPSWLRGLVQPGSHSRKPVIA